MIDALIAGRLVGAPVERVGPSGKPFTTAKLRVPVADGDALFCSTIAFAGDVRKALAALGDGDSIALSGPLTVKTWTDKAGTVHPALDLVAHAVVTPYHTRRKRQAVQEAAP